MKIIRSFSLVILGVSGLLSVFCAHAGARDRIPAGIPVARPARTNWRQVVDLADTYVFSRDRNDPTVDYSHVLRLYTQAASQNRDLWAKAQAQTRLGDMYYSGLGVAIDYPRARRLYDQVINQQVNLAARASAQVHVAGMYYDGNGVDVDYDRARDFFEQVAQQQDNEA
ncbi:hypothetical protein CVU75_03520, partial [Candidatus Dependentiae bacterium HGW-Dependentiae-1]